MQWQSCWWRRWTSPHKTSQCRGLTGSWKRAKPTLHPKEHLIKEMFKEKTTKQTRISSFLFVCLYSMGSSNQQINSAEQVLKSEAKTRPLDCRLAHRGHMESTTEMRHWEDVQNACSSLENDCQKCSLLCRSTVHSFSQIWDYWAQTKLFLLLTPTTSEEEENMMETNLRHKQSFPQSNQSHHSTIWAKIQPSMQDWYILIGIIGKLF